MSIILKLKKKIDDNSPFNSVAAALLRLVANHFKL